MVIAKSTYFFCHSVELLKVFISQSVGEGLVRF